MSRKAIVFLKVPVGTHYRRGAWSWVSEDLAEEYISQGVGVEWDVRRGEPVDEEYRPWSEKRMDLIPPPKPERVMPLYTPIPVEDLTMEHLWRKIFVSMKKAGYPVNERMTKSKMLEMR